MNKIIEKHGWFVDNGHDHKYNNLLTQIHDYAWVAYLSNDNQKITS